MVSLAFALVIVAMLLTAGLVAALTLGGVGAALAWELRQQVGASHWRCEWRGRALHLVASPLSQALWIDGIRVTEASDGLPATLAATVDGVRLTAVVATEGRVRRGRLYANDEWIGGDPRPQSLPPMLSQAPEEPRDARWPPARALLAELGGTASADEAVDLEAALRDVLLRIDRRDADESALDPGRTRHAVLTAVHTRLEADATRLLDALRDLHAHAVAAAAAPASQRIDDLVARAQAEREVEALAPPRTRTTPTPKIRTRGPLPDRAS